MDDSKKKSIFRTRVKTLVATWVTVLLFALPIAGVVLVRPEPVRAQGAPTIDISAIVARAGIFIKDVILEGLKQGAALAFKNALKVFVSQIAYDTAVWIGSGDANQKPLLYTKNAGDYLADLGDAAAGEFLNTLFSDNGYFSFNLCEPVDVNQKLYLGLLIGLGIPNSDYDLGLQLPSGELPTVECTLSDIVNNFQEASLSTDFATGIAVLFIPTNNDFGVLGSAVGAGYAATATQKEEGVINRVKGDFADAEGKVSGYTATPSSAIEHQYFLSLDASSYPQTTYTGHLIADTLDIFTSTLISKLLDRLKNGLISDFTTPDIGDSLSGSSSTSGGVTAAQEKYLTLKQVPVTRGSSLDILSDMTNCPDEGAEVTNCVIDNGFQSAVEQGLTVQQAIDQGLIDGSKPFAMGSDGVPVESPDQGIPFRSSVILKHYRIVPVGWQIAAEYIRDFGGTAVSLQDLIDAYDQCDSTTYSPFCKLIDPDWVLTTPGGICNLLGYGQNILSARFADDDALDSTPERPNILRAQSCVDDQSCLKEDSDGNCVAYGYCTEEKRIYRFQGDECPEQYSSCQTYSNPDGKEVSYLRDTLNYNNCDANSVGCQWYCTEYNDINLDWQCSANGLEYNSCGTSAFPASSSGTCTCKAADDSTCDMLDGAFRCTTSTGSTCTLGTEDDTQSGLDTAINFNNQIKTCDSGDVGCTTFVRTTTGANLVFNSSFEYFDTYSEAPEDVLRGDAELSDTTADTFGFFSAEAADPGAACSADTTSSFGTTNECIGWQTGGTVLATGNDVFDGFVAAELSGPATLTNTLETGYTLGNRTFDVSLWVQNNSTTECNGLVELNGDLLDNPDYTGIPTKNVTFKADGTWTQVEFDPYTFSTLTTTDTALSLEIIVPLDCGRIKVDAVDLSETDDVADYTAYGTSEEISMNGDRLSCDTSDVGCELYTPVGGSQDEAIPGKITNPLSDACTSADGFASPDCSLCNGTTSDDEFVGCDFYQEQPLANGAPIPNLAGFAATPPTGTEREGIVQRTGFYCNNDGYAGVSCYDDADCGGSSNAYTSCVDSVSVIPSTADTCSAQYVGCEEYTNLDTVAEGGEGLEDYSYIRQCVKDTPEERTAGSIKTFVTFEGSDVSGYSLRSWNLKKSNLDDGPCTNLDLYGSTAQTSNASCVDTAETQRTCTAADLGVNPDCTEYIDPNTSAGTTYYRLASYTVSATDDCHPLRNNLDGRTYFSVPSESTSCPATQNLCREYKGSAGGDVFQAINEGFEDSVWDPLTSSGTVEQSSESTAAGGHSMHLNSAGATFNLVTSTDDGGLISALDEGKTYIIKMWMKKANGTDGGLSVYFNSDTSTSIDKKVYFVNNDVNAVSSDTVSISADNWKEYTFGPVIMPRAGAEDDELVISWTSATTDLYVDNVVLEASDAQYLIKNTAETCAGYEGCQDYTNRNGDKAYIKSFSKLCEEQFVGCEALITTQNSDSPFTQNFLNDNSFTSATGEGPNDDVQVAEDQVVAFVNDEANYCNASVAGCMALGLPDEDETTGLANSFTTVNYINDPDSYGNILCEADALQCDEFTDSNGETTYFKDPGNKTCDYRQETSGTDFGWFVTGSDEPCPLFDEGANPGQPQGAVCDTGTRGGLFCVSDSDCPDDDATDTVTPHCRSDFTTDADTNGVADSGWTGTCSSAYSGCTEYQDANTDNLIPNGDFEEDQYTYDPSTGTTDDSTILPDVVPDYMEEYSLFQCDTFDQTANEAHGGSYSLKVAQDGLTSTGDGIGCEVVPEERISIDTAQTYTLSLNVLVNRGFEGTANETQVSAGLFYFNVGGSLITPPDVNGSGSYDQADVAAFNIAMEAETTGTTDEGTWRRYTGEIGNRLEDTWPSVDNIWGQDAVSVLPFVYVYTPSGVPVYVDDFTLTQNSPYFYVNTSVDGAPESDQNTCNGVVNIANGCVDFRDVTNDSLTYLSTVETEQLVNSAFSVADCTIGATEDETTNCRFNPNTADGNVVLQVKPDRECAEWLTCQTASITQDSSGNDEVTCLDIGRCDQLSDSGTCADNVGSTDAADLDGNSDLTFHTTAGATLALDAIKNLSGYSTVGANWGKTDGTCDSSSVCSGGPNAGHACITDGDCQETQILQGYYPYEEMVQEGIDGLNTGNDDLIQQGDFEEVICSGQSTQEMEIDGTNATVDQIFASSKDSNQRCTFDDQCRNQDTEEKIVEIASAVDQGISVSTSAGSFRTDFNYSEGWCDNPDSAGEAWGSFSPSNERVIISIIDYDQAIEFDNPLDVFSDAPLAGSSTLDLNNVLYVEPSGSGSGVEYALPDVSAITNGDQYALSFTAAWAKSAQATSELTAGLLYSDGSTDYFQSCNENGNCSQTGIELNSTMRSFAMTVTAANKPVDATTVSVFVYENDDTAFYIDDLSMLPVLEVNQQSLDDVARECRAYPAEDALLCNYTESNGTVNQGIQGYCLEHDAMNQNKCVTWWPVDVIAGNPDARNKEAAGYSGRANVYYCAVAKGLQDLKVCDGGSRDGAFCSGITHTDSNGDGVSEDDDYCQGTETTGTCVTGYYYNDQFPDQYSSIASSDVVAKDDDDRLALGEGGYEVSPRQITVIMGDSDGAPEAFVRSSPANAFEKAITLADINQLRLNFSAVQESGEDSDQWPSGHYSAGDTGDGEIDADGNVTNDGTNAVAIGDYTDDAGAVKGTKCAWDAFDIDGDGNGSIKFVREAAKEGKDLGYCDRDPFNLVSPLWPVEIVAVLNKDGISESNLEESPSIDLNNLVAFNFVFKDSVLDYVEYIVTSGIDDDAVILTVTMEVNLNETCALAVQAVDDQGETTAWVKRLTSSSTYQLPNTGYGYSEANSPFGSVHSSLTDTPDLWNGDSVVAHGDPTPFDSHDTGTLILFRNSATDGSGLPLACIGKCDDSMCAEFDEAHPTDYGTSNQECNENEDYSCSDNTGSICLGVDGDNSFSVSASSTGTYTDKDGSFQIGISGNAYTDQLHAAMNIAQGDFKLIFAKPEGNDAWVREQAEDNSLVSDPRYSQDFWEAFGISDIYDAMDECSGTRSSTDYCGNRPTVEDIQVNGQQGDVNISAGESVTLDFGTTADDNQVPIENIRIDWEGIDGNDWSDFDSSNDTNDAWEAAPSTDHIYSHAYSDVCDETNPHYQSSSSSAFAGKCIYEIRIQVEDHWGFCSGLQNHNDFTDYRDSGSGSCTSYDEFPSYVVVSPR